MSLIKKEEYKGYWIEIHVDECPINPRTEFSNAGKMFFNSDTKHLGDKHSYSGVDSDELKRRTR